MASVSLHNFFLHNQEWLGLRIASQFPHFRHELLQRLPRVLCRLLHLLHRGGLLVTVGGGYPGGHLLTSPSPNIAHILVNQTDPPVIVFMDHSLLYLKVKIDDGVLLQMLGSLLLSLDTVILVTAGVRLHTHGREEIKHSVVTKVVGHCSELQ